MHAVPGSIQSIERAVAVLRLLASTDRPLGLAELAAALDLPRPTVHGIVRTLRDVEFVVQEAGGGSRYLPYCGSTVCHRHCYPS